MNSGIRINKCEDRLVSIHSQRLSPLNAQIVLEDDVLHSFYSVGIFENRAIVTFHLIPENQIRGNQVHEIVSASANTKDLFEQLSKIDTEWKKQIVKMQDFVNKCS